MVWGPGDVWAELFVSMAGPGDISGELIWELDAAVEELMVD
jgi:hypothetical protein